MEPEKQDWASRLRQRPRKKSFPDYVLTTRTRKPSKRTAPRQASTTHPLATNAVLQADSNDSVDEVSAPVRDQPVVLAEEEPLATQQEATSDVMDTAQIEQHNHGHVESMSVDTAAPPEEATGPVQVSNVVESSDARAPQPTLTPAKRGRKRKAPVENDGSTASVEGTVPGLGHNDNNTPATKKRRATRSQTASTKKRTKTIEDGEQQEEEADSAQNEVETTAIITRSTRRAKGKGRATDQASTSTTDVQLIPPAAHLAQLPVELTNGVISFLSSGSHNMTSFGRLALTCRPLFNIVSHNRFWQDVASTAGLPAPNPRSRKTNTWMKVVTTNYHKLCLECRKLFPRRAGLCGVTMGDGSHGQACWTCFKKLWRAFKQQEDNIEEEVGQANITKGRATSEYRLTEQQLNLLSCRYVRNPHYRSAAPMNLFQVPDVIRLAYFVHGGKEGLEAAKEAKVAKAEERKRKAEERVQQRKDYIISLLQARNIPASAADSARFTNYIQTGDSDEGALELVEEERQERILNALKAQRREEFRKRLEALGVSWPENPEELKYGEEYALCGTDLDELVALEKARDDRDVLEETRREEYESRAQALGLVLPITYSGVCKSPHLKAYIRTGMDLEGHLARERLDKTRREQTPAEREAELVAALKARGLTLRSDSRLCEAYIRMGTGDGRTLEEVVEIMVEMDWYFRCSDYEYIRDEDAESRCTEYGYDCYYVNRRDSEESKRIALDRWVYSRFHRGVWWSPRNDPPNGNRPPETIWNKMERLLSSHLETAAEQKLSQFLKQYSGTMGRATATAAVQATEPTTDDFYRWLDIKYKCHPIASSSTASSSSGPLTSNPSNITFSQVLRSLNPDIDRAFRRKIRAAFASPPTGASASASASTCVAPPVPTPTTMHTSAIASASTEVCF